MCYGVVCCLNRTLKIDCSRSNARYVLVLLARVDSLIRNMFHIPIFDNRTIIHKISHCSKQGIVVVIANRVVLLFQTNLASFVRPFSDKPFLVS